MIKLNYIFFAAAVLFPQLSFSEESSETQIQNPISTIKDFINFDDKLSIRAFINPSTFMTLSMSKNNKNIKYKSNHRGSLGFGLSYNGYGFSAAIIKDKQCYRDEDKYGKTKYYDLLLSKYGKHIGAEFFIRKYTGMYIENYPESLPREGKKRSDTELSFIGGYINYTFFEKFSFNEMLKQSERRLGFSWSPLVGLYYDYFDFSSNGNLIYTEKETDLVEFLKIKSSSYNGGGILTGIGAKYCFATKLYISTSLSLGCGAGKLRTNGNESYSKYALNEKIVVKVAAGFNGDSFGCGIIGSSEKSNYYINDSNVITPFANYIEFFLLLRF